MRGFLPLTFFSFFSFFQTLRGVFGAFWGVDGFIKGKSAIELDGWIISG